MVCIALYFFFFTFQVHKLKEVVTYISAGLVIMSVILTL